MNTGVLKGAAPWGFILPRRTVPWGHRTHDGCLAQPQGATWVFSALTCQESLEYVPGVCTMGVVDPIPWKGARQLRKKSSYEGHNFRKPRWLGVQLLHSPIPKKFWGSEKVEGLMGTFCWQNSNWETILEQHNSCSDAVSTTKSPPSPASSYHLSGWMYYVPTWGWCDVLSVDPSQALSLERQVHVVSGTWKLFHCIYHPSIHPLWATWDVIHTVSSAFSPEFLRALRSAISEWLF